MSSNKDKENQNKISQLNKQIEELKEEIKNCEAEKPELEKEIEELKKKNEEYYDQLLRLKAEFENYRKRVEKEKSELAEWVKYDVMLSILPLYDMLKMAQDHISQSPSDIENLKVGLGMIFSEFDKLFESMGLSELDVLNKQYDPMTCEIVGTVEGDGENEGLVVEVVQPGYIAKNRLIRPAKVKIVKKSQPSKEASELQGDEGKNQN